MVTLAAFADRAVGTALPTVVRDFDSPASFGLANAAPAGGGPERVDVLHRLTERVRPWPQIADPVAVPV